MVWCSVFHLAQIGMFYRNSVGVPIFEKPPPKYSTYKMMQILLGIDEKQIAHKRLLLASFSSTFVVDIRTLAHPDDIKKDMYGKWVHSGSHTYDGDEINIENAACGASGVCILIV